MRSWKCENPRAKLNSCALSQLAQSLLLYTFNFVFKRVKIDISHPSQPGHDNGGGYGHPSQPGHGGGYDDHGQMELRQSFRRIQSLFSLVENSFFPGMTRRDMMECARNMNQIEREVSEVLRQVPMMAARDLEGVRYTVGQARFSLMTDFNAREAHQLVRRASMDFNMVSDRLIRR